MKSDPLRSLSPSTWTSPGGVASAACVMTGGGPAWVAAAPGRAGAVCASAAPGGDTSAAAPASAPCWRNLRRRISVSRSSGSWGADCFESFDLSIGRLLSEAAQSDM